MNTQKIYRKNDHRPLPMPDGKWVVYQEWHKVLFLHWAVNPSLLMQYVPNTLKVQSYKGASWVSLVVFRLKNVRPRYLPPIPLLSNADEINIRTYVEFKGKPGIFFLSMELGKHISNLLAKYLTGLPYRFSKTQNSATHYRSKNNEFKDELDLEFEIRNKILKKSELDKWLTERYALFQDSRSPAIIEYEVHHYEWPLHKVNLAGNTVNYKRFGSLLSGNPDLIHYSPGVEVLTWGIKKHRTVQYESSRQRI